MTPFSIAPLLDKGVQYDPYASVLVAKIRAGKYTADLWDCNSLYLGSPLRPPQEAFACKSRYKMTAEQHKEYREELQRKWLEEASQRKERAALAELRREMAEAHAAAQAKRQAELERRDRDWEGKGQRGREARAILNGHWECASCLRAAEIEADVLRPGVYFLGCRTCGRSVSADHATLIAMIARKAQLEPAAPG